MSGCIVVLSEGTNRERWISSAVEMGLKINEFDFLPNILHVICAPSVLPRSLKLECDIVDPDDCKILGAADQSLIIESDLSGANWGIARTISRERPWSASLNFPVESSFRATLNGEGVDYYSFDSGVLVDHIEFSDRVSIVYEIYSTGGDGDDNGHGTQTASLSCGGTVGIARRSNIFSIKILNSANTGTTAELLSGINAMLTHYSTRSNPAVANLSLVGYPSSVSSAITSMINAGIVVVACAGNKGANLDTSDNYPAESDPLVIVVGGTNMLDGPYYSNAIDSLTAWGNRVDVSAPSQRVYAATIGAGGDSYAVVNGTSYGCGIASGVVACSLQGRGKLSGRSDVSSVRNHIILSATTGRLKQWSNDDNNFTEYLKLPDRILYMDPEASAPIDFLD